MMIPFVILLAMLLSILSFYAAVGFLLPSRHSIRTKRDRYTEIQGSRIRYVCIDNPGPTLIMLHGFGGDYTSWNRLSSSIPGARIFAIDLLGFGLSDAPRIKYDLETQSQYLIEFMNRMNIHEAVLVGASMGASIALWTSSHWPARISGVIGFAPSGIPGSMRHRWPGNLLYRPNLMNKFVRLLLRPEVFNTLFPHSLARQALDSSASYDQSFTRAISSIVQPVLIIWSRGDRRVPFNTSIRYRELLPQAEFLEAPEGVGHPAHRNPTPEIIEAVCRFVRTVQKSD